MRLLLMILLGFVNDPLAVSCGILEAFAENPSDLIQFALVKKSVMKSFPSLAEKKI